MVSGGGSGHEPLHAGLRPLRHARCRVSRAGVHLATPDQVAAEAVDGGADILFIVKNDTGDVMNLEMPAEMVPGAQACVLTVRQSSVLTIRRYNARVTPKCD